MAKTIKKVTKSPKEEKNETYGTSSEGLKILKELTDKLFELMNIKSKVEVSEDKENNAYMVDIKGETETGLLIGARGRTLISIQMVLGLMYRQKTGEWARVILNVSDYREKEEERLKDLAKQSAERAKTTGEPQYLYNLTPSQRRIVHMSLSEDSDITTESQGEGVERFLVVTANN